MIIAVFSEASEALGAPPEMPMPDYQRYIKHLQSIIAFYEDAPKTNTGILYEGDAHGVLARAESAIRKICDENSSYLKRMEKILEDRYTDAGTKSALLIGVIKTLKGDLEDGYLASVPELIRAEMFESFTDMARHLVNGGYKDAVAVLAGSTLEGHLRRMARKNNISVNHTTTGGTTAVKKAEQLNQELRSTGAYTLFDQKQITAWLDLRNNAAHGNYSAYDENQVASLIEWVGDFVAKNPA